MDSHCISTLSVVLSGQRRWRIGPVPRMPRGGGRSRDGDVVFDDGVAYNLKWKPMFEFTANEGDAVLFPPGWIHETLNTADGCTVALTTQFRHPEPVSYYRAYYPRLRRVGDMNSCWRSMAKWGSLAGGKPRSKKPAEVRAHADALFDARNGSFSVAELGFFDLDGDRQVSREELVDTYAAWVATESAVGKEKLANMPRVDMSFAAPGGGLSAGRAEL